MVQMIVVSDPVIWVLLWYKYFNYHDGWIGGVERELSDFRVVMTHKIQESQTYCFSARLTSSRILKLHESILPSREDSFTRKFLFETAFLF